MKPTIQLISNLGKRCNTRKFRLVAGEAHVTSLVLTETGKRLQFVPAEYWCCAELAGKRIPLRPDRSLTVISTDVWRAN